MSRHAECSDREKVPDSIANTGSRHVRASSHNWRPRYLALARPVRLGRRKVPDSINYVLILIKFALHGVIDPSVDWCTYSNVSIYLFIIVRIKKLCTLINWLSIMDSLKNVSNSIGHYSNQMICWGFKKNFGQYFFLFSLYGRINEKCYRNFF